MSTTAVEDYLSARRAAIKLWRAKQDLVDASLATLHECHPAFAIITSLAVGDCPICTLRLFADNSLCFYAERIGDEAFRNTMDDLPSVTHWFYGTVCPTSRKGVHDRTAPSHLELLLRFEDFTIWAHTFCQRVSQLPFLNRTRFRCEEERLHDLIGRLQRAFTSSTPLFCAYALLSHRLPSQVARLIVSF